MSNTVDEERWRTVDAASDTCEKVIAHARGVYVRCQLILKLPLVGSDVARVLHQVAIVQRVLVLEDGVVHFPEQPLARRGFGGLGRELRMWMNLAKRKVAEDKAQSRVKTSSGAPSLSGTLSTVRTFIVAIFDKRQCGVSGTLRVIAGRHRDAQPGDSFFMFMMTLLPRPPRAPPAHAECRRRLD